MRARWQRVKTWIRAGSWWSDCWSTSVSVKAAAQMLAQKQQVEEATWTNPGMREFRDDAGAEREIAADTIDLVRVFQDVLARLKARPVLNVDEESVTVAQMIDYVKRRLLMEDAPVSLRRMLHNTPYGACIDLHVSGNARAGEAAGSAIAPAGADGGHLNQEG